jgi:hypothetical protein
VHQLLHPKPESHHLDDVRNKPQCQHYCCHYAALHSLWARAIGRALSGLTGYVQTAGPPSEVAALSKVTAAHLEAGFYALMQTKAQRREYLSVRTVQHVAGLVNVALNKAFKLELIPVNPMLRVELPTWDQKDARSLNPEEIRGLERECA